MQARGSGAASRRPRGRRGGRRGRGGAHSASMNTSGRDRSPYGRPSPGRSSSESAESYTEDGGFFLSDTHVVAENRRASRRDEGWMFDSLVEQLARERGGRDEDEDEDEDFERRYYYDSDDDDDESDSMFFANLHAIEAGARGSASRGRARPARARASRTPPPPQPPPEPALCRFFVLGKCRYGSHCTYSHALPSLASDCEVSTEDGLDAAAALVDCPFFQRGNCKYGDFCRLRHANSVGAGSAAARGFTTASSSSTARSSARDGSAAANAESNTQTNSQDVEFTCGICFEDIVQAGKHFGLLACDHCFCLDCLRSWRQSKDMEVEVIRACPACRQPSDFVLPSLTFCTGDAKARAVEAYKRHLALRECKYFNGALGSCPFGPHCFYAHRDAHGRDVKHLDRPKRSAKSRRGSGAGGMTEAALTSLLSNYSHFFRFLEMVEMDDYDSESD